MISRNQDGASTLPISDVAQTLENTLADADPRRAGHLDALSQVRSAKDAGLKREHARLASALGPDHPRVAAMAAKIDLNKKLADNVAAEAARAKTVPVVVDPGAWILHGRVSDRQGKGVPELTVALYDSQGAWAEWTGHGCTDSTGYFKIRVAVGGAASETSHPASNEEAAEHRHVFPSIGARHIVTPTGAAPPLWLFVHLLNRDSKTVYADKRPLTPAIGKVAYIDIVLGDEEAICSPPQARKAPPSSRSQKGK